MTRAAADPFGWVGAIIDGKYRVDEVVGSGGFGVVYRAHHLGFEEDVAIKCLRLPDSLEGEDRARFFESFMAEGRLLHRLSRATVGIVQALDVGAADSPSGAWTPYLVMEWLEGSTLDADLEAREAEGAGGRPLDEAIALLEPAARALAIAHDQGVAHRDVKPANLFLADVGGNRMVKVLDFGIAKVITESQSVTKAFEVTGRSLQAFTARYGAPEQFSRRFGATGPWTDVFALALVFVEVVCGAPALDGGDAAQLFVSASDTYHRPTLRARGAASSDSLEAVLSTALAVDPKNRYRSAGEFWDALLAAAGAESLVRPPVSAGSRAPVNRDAPTQLAASSPVPGEPGRTRRRGRARAVAAMLVVLAAVGSVAGVVLWRSGKAPQPSGEAPAPIPSARPRPLLAEVAPFSVPAGRVADVEVWLAGFSVRQVDRRGGVTLPEARSQCRKQQHTLCTELQWRRACATHPALGRVASWTTTGDDEGFFVRGGESCDSKRVAPGSDVRSDLGAVCCDRSIGIQTKNRNKSFLAATASKLVDFERTVNQHDAIEFGLLLDDTVSVDGTPHTPAQVKAMLQASYERWPSQWASIDSCKVSYQSSRRTGDSGKASATWSARCRQSRFRGNEASVVFTQYVFTGNGLLESIDDVNVVRDWSKL